MIIRLQGATADGLDAARAGLADLAGGWGHPLAQVPNSPTGLKPDAGKVVDPVSVAA